MLIPQATLKAYADKLAAVWEQLKPVLGSTADPVPVVGTARNLANGLLSVCVATADYEQELDLSQGAATAFNATGVEPVSGFLLSALTALNGHCAKRGPSLNSTITSLSSYLTYLNTTPTGTPFACLLPPGYSDLYYALLGVRMPALGFYSRGISPLLDAALYPAGLGARAVGGAFVAGNAADVTKYSEVSPVLTVTTTFAGGTAPPSVVAAGTDSAGNAATTWTLALDSNNPAAAVATTITPATLAWARQTVAVASLAGIVPGSVLTVDANLPTQESVVVEAVNTGAVTLTAVFRVAHLAGAALTGLRSYTLPPSVAGVRMRSCSGITLTATGHSAGAVRIDGAQDRRAA